MKSASRVRKGVVKMSESKTPVIQISGTVAEKDYILAVLLFDLGISFYYWYPVLKDGNITFAQWLNEAWGTVFRVSFGTCLIAGFLVLFAVYLIVIRPGLAKKAFTSSFRTVFLLLMPFMTTRW